MTESTIRASYDVIAIDYARRSADELVDQPLDRAVLAAFAEYVTAAGGGPVADLGCGPGHTTAHLRALGLDVSGVDLSPGMVTAARRAHPLAPGGQALLAFQAGEGHRQGTEWLGHAVSLDLYLRPPEEVAGLLADAGLAVHAQLVREPVGSGETQPRAFLVARKLP